MCITCKLEFLKEIFKESKVQVQKGRSSPFIISVDFHKGCSKENIASEIYILI